MQPIPLVATRAKPPAAAAQPAAQAQQGGHQTAALPHHPCTGLETVDIEPCKGAFGLCRPPRFTD